MLIGFLWMLKNQHVNPCRQRTNTFTNTKFGWLLAAGAVFADFHDAACIARPGLGSQPMRSMARNYSVAHEAKAKLSSKVLYPLRKDQIVRRRIRRPRRMIVNQCESSRSECENSGKELGRIEVYMGSYSAFNDAKLT